MFLFSKVLNIVEEEEVLLGVKLSQRLGAASKLV